MNRNYDAVIIAKPVSDKLYTSGGEHETIDHPVVNSAVALNGFGDKVGLIGRVGDDKGGQTVIKGLGSEGIDTARVRVDELPTAKCSIRVTPKEREILQLEDYHPLEGFDEADRAYAGASRSLLFRASPWVLRFYLSLEYPGTLYTRFMMQDVMEFHVILSEVQSPV